MSERDDDELTQRCALALMRVDLDLVPPAARDRARKLLARSSDEFDGAQLVDICLEDGATSTGGGTRTIQRAMLALRGRFLGMDMKAEAPRRQRRRSGFKRFVAWLLVKLMFWPILVALTVVILVLVKRNWPEVDIYVWGGKALDFIGLR